jgi:nucleotide-binding universal stress UspA family protein
MNFKRILVATDFSEHSTAALDVASNLASETGARLFIMHVDEVAEVGVPALPPYEGGYLFQAPYGYKRREVRERLEKVVPTVANVTFEHCYVTGLPIAQIVQLIVEKQIDLIVIGSHGRTGVSRLLVGSVAEGVMRRAACPVLVVKQKTAQGSSTEISAPALSHQPGILTGRSTSSTTCCRRG